MKTTKKDFELFKKEFIKWINKFGLNDIHFNFVWNGKNHYAKVYGEHSQKMYVVFFGKEFTDMEKMPVGYIKYIAYHEACESLLYRIRTIATNREFNEEELDSEIHMVINRLEKLLLNGCYFEVETEDDE